MAERPGSLGGYMDAAIAEAKAALSHGEVPIGAVAVVGNQVIATAHNEKESTFDPTAHAEIVLIRRVGLLMTSWRLQDVRLFVTLEPCPMCAEAINQARIGEVVYGCDDIRYGGYSRGIITPRMPVIAGIREGECREIIDSFFKNRRGE